MNERGDSPPLYIWDVSTLYSWNQKQVKSFYQYLPSSLHSWQCFVMAIGLVFCILNQKDRNIDCPNLHKAAYIKTAWILPVFRIATKQVVILNLSMIAFLNRDASLKRAKAVQNWSQTAIWWFVFCIFFSLKYFVRLKLFWVSGLKQPMRIFAGLRLPEYITVLKAIFWQDLVEWE